MIKEENSAQKELSVKKNLQVPTQMEQSEYLLTIAEKLLQNSGIPSELFQKYSAIKRLICEENEPYDKELPLEESNKLTSSKNKGGKTTLKSSLQGTTNLQEESSEAAEQKTAVKRSIFSNRKLSTLVVTSGSEYQARQEDSTHKEASERKNRKSEAEHIQKMCTFFTGLIDQIFAEYMHCCTQLKDLAKGDTQSVSDVEPPTGLQIDALELARELNSQQEEQELNADSSSTAELIDYEEYARGHLSNVETCAKLCGKVLSNIKKKIGSQNYFLDKFKQRISTLDLTEATLRNELDSLRRKLTETHSTNDENREILRLSQQLTQLREESDTLNLNYTLYKDGTISDMHEKLREIEENYTQAIHEIQEDGLLVEQQQQEQSSGRLVSLKATNSAVATQEEQDSPRSTDAAIVHQCYEELSGKYVEAFESFTAANQSSQSNSETVNFCYFMLFLLQKFEDDNTWLLDKLTEFGQENEVLRNTCRRLTEAQEGPSETSSTRPILLPPEMPSQSSSSASYCHESRPSSRAFSNDLEQTFNQMKRQMLQSTLPPRQQRGKSLGFS